MEMCDYNSLYLFTLCYLYPVDEFGSGLVIGRCIKNNRFITIDVYHSIAIYLAEVGGDEVGDVHKDILTQRFDF